MFSLVVLYVIVNNFFYILKILLVFEKEFEVDGMGNFVSGFDGKQKYKCGFRIGGGIDQDNIKSSQGYLDKVLYLRRSYLFYCILRCVLYVDIKSQFF